MKPFLFLSFLFNVLSVYTQLDCTNAIPVQCNMSYAVPAAFAPSLVSTYGCNNWTETGPERIYTFTPNVTGAFSAVLTSFNPLVDDLDVYILRSCDPLDCLGQVSSDSAYFEQGVAGVTYYIVIDSDNGSGASCDLTIKCYGVEDTTAVDTCALTVSLIHTDETALEANDGTAIVLVESEIGPYTVSWSTGSVLDTIDNLSPGSYAVIVTDSLSCVDSAQVEILPYLDSVPEDTCLLEAIAIANNESATGANDGTVTVNYTGAQGEVTYLWSTADTVLAVNDLAPAVYFVTLTDSVGCMAFASAQVLAYGDTSNVNDSCAFTIQVNGTNLSLSGASDGSATVQVNQSAGAVGGYEYVWNNGLEGPAIYGLTEGVYLVTVTDDANCIQTGLTFITDQAAVDSSNSIFDQSFVYQEFSIFPNPATHKVQIEWAYSALQDRALFFKVFDSFGKLIVKHKVPLSQKEFTLNVEAFTEGLYFLATKGKAIPFMIVR